MNRHRTRSVDRAPSEAVHLVAAVRVSPASRASMSSLGERKVAKVKVSHSVIFSTSLRRCSVVIKVDAVLKHRQKARTSCSI